MTESKNVIDRPTLVLHTTCFEAGDPDGPNEERAAAFALGQELYDLLTRPSGDPLAWGPGIPVRLATQPALIATDEAERVVVVPVLGVDAFQNEKLRRGAIAAVRGWSGAAATVLPVFTSTAWRSVEHELGGAPILRHVSNGGWGPTIQEILCVLARVLSRDGKASTRLFISHAKDDLKATDHAADKIHRYVTTETTALAFFDKVSVLPGEALGPQLDAGIGDGVFVVVRGDRYSSRAWCRRELLRAKQLRMPALTVEVLSAGELRSATYGGNAPSLPWSRTSPLAAAQVATAAMVERVRHLFFLAEGSRVIRAANLPPSTECLSRPPELLDLSTLGGNSLSALIVLHPDPPLPVFERTVLEEGAKRARAVTPTTAFANLCGSSIRSPLDGRKVALSLSDSPDAPESGSPRGITASHVKDATVFLARSLIGMGAAIAYGGDFRTNGFTPLLAQTVIAYNETARTNADFLHSYLAAQLSSTDAKELSVTVHPLRSEAQAVLQAPARGSSLAPHRQALYFSDMRRLMALETAARVVMAGKNRPASHHPDGYLGLYPGVVEEAWWTLKAHKPLYVIGGFGGAGALVAEALEQDEPPPELREETWIDNAVWKAFADAWAADPDVQRLGLPKTPRELAAHIREFGRRHLAADAASVEWNGLSVTENRVLFRTTDPLTLSALVSKGLLAMANRAASGKLQIELFQGDVTSATELELLAFPVFRDVPPEGAAAALDAVTRGAARKSQQTQAPVSTRSSALGVDYVLAADLGEAAQALLDVEAATCRAALSVANVIRSHGFRRVGVVTFLGNVVGDSSLTPAVNGMLKGLQGIADRVEVVWFERDAARVEALAQVLGQDASIVLTRRAPALPPVPSTVEEQRRTVITAKLVNGELEVGLFFHRANGLAPVIRTMLDDAKIAALAHTVTAAAPSQAELERRGPELAKLLFGESVAARADVRGSELLIMHDAAAARLPYEAMSFRVGEGICRPAAEKGIVRRLIAEGIGADSALVRARPGRQVGVTVIINPTEDLAGAQAEGETLVAKLQAGSFVLKVLNREKATIARVREAFADPETDILHYCGHGFYKGPGSSQSGLQCADGALTLEELQQRPWQGAVPRLAFVNACQAARVRAFTESKPEAFAEFFLHAGVDAYLGTYWLVSDEGAATFAATVYEQLAAGRELGAAVVAGRKALHGIANSDWANYVLYGNAGFRLVE